MFILLTSTRGEEFLVNSDHVMIVCHNTGKTGGSLIVLSDGSSYNVIEEFSTIRSYLRNAEK